MQRGLAEKPPARVYSPRPSEAFLSRLERLRTWRKETGEEVGGPSDVILPRDLLTRLAEQNPQRPEELQVILQDVPWRLEHFGSQILDILQR